MERRQAEVTVTVVPDLVTGDQTGFSGWFKPANDKGAYAWVLEDEFQ